MSGLRRAVPSEASERVLYLRGLLADLHRLTADITPENIDCHEAVGIGRELWRLTDRAQKAINMVKDVVREAAPDSAGTHRLYGADGALCIVSVPEPQTVLRRDVDREDLRNLLGEGGFDRLFETRVRVIPRKDFNEEVLVMDENYRQVALDAVDTVSQPPRITFPKSQSRK